MTNYTASQQSAQAFAHEWIQAWNSHNLDQIMIHYADDVEFCSPFVVKLFGKPDGIIYGLGTLRTYFEKGLSAYPTLRFELFHALLGVNSITLVYRSVIDLLAAEVMVFNADNQVSKVLAHYR